MNDALDGNQVDNKRYSIARYNSVSQARFSTTT